MKRRYWVISPNVSNKPSEESLWKKIITEEHLAFMGWGDDHDFGKKFKNEIQIGDFILIAQGANRQKKLFIGGIVSSDAQWELYKDTLDPSFRRKLKPCLEKRELEVLELNFDGTAYGAADRIPALYELHPDKNKADKLLVEKIDKAIIDKMNKQIMKETIDLLRYKKQIILQGPPGTGKTRLAKKIVNQMMQPHTIDISDIRKNIKIGQEVPTISDRGSFVITEITEKELIYVRNSTSNKGRLTFNDIVKGYSNKIWEKVRNGSDSYAAGVSKYIFDNYVSDEYSLIQFHPSYTYEDFVRGIVSKPNPVGSGVLFSCENKLLGDLAKEAYSNYQDSQKPSAELSKEKLLDKYFEAFVEDIELQLEKAPLLLKDTTISIINLDEDAFRYKGVEGWNKDGNRMLFKDIKQAYLDGNNSRQDIKKNERLSGLAIQHASYYIRVVNLFTDYLKENKLTFENLKEVKTEKKKYILIIDEINRANLSSVLGELIYALEYRGEEVDSMYKVDNSNKIVLPPNLYIIGTMNTADRSVGHIDYAIRRRFAFVEILPRDLSNELKTDFKSELFKTVANLFNHDTNLSREFNKNEVQLGHSYFIQHYEKDKNNNDNKNKPIDFKLRLDYEIKPILLEYVKDGILIGKVKDQSIEDFIKNLTT